MEKAFINVYNVDEARGVNIRLSAYMIGVQKMTEASLYEVDLTLN
jgi:glutamate dehydrogenase/leucine dehydrogenase